MRTTSSLESLNAQINRFFSVKHPNIFEFMQNLKGFEYYKYRMMLEKTGEPISISNSRKRKRDQNREEKIAYFTNLIATNQIDVDDFLNSMANREILPIKGDIYFFSYFLINLTNSYFFLSISSTKTIK